MQLKHSLMMSMAATLVAADQAPKVKLNPKNVVAIADFPLGFSRTVLGNVIFTAKQGKQVQVHVDMTGLPREGGPFQYHIHERAVPSNGDCDAVGYHFNPYNAPPECDLQKDDSFCQVGDLSGKHGWIDTTCFETKYDDPFLSLNQRLTSYIIGKSVTFHFANLTKFACANIEIASKEKLQALYSEFTSQDEAVIESTENSQEYADYFQGDAFAGYEFEEEDALTQEVFELATENNEDGYEYAERAKSLRYLKVAEVEDDEPANATNSTVQDYESSSCNHADSLASKARGIPTMLGLLFGLII